MPSPLQTALQKLPINVPRSASSEALHSVLVKDVDDITPRDALSALASELLLPPPPPSGARRSPPAVKEQLLNGSQDDELPIEADAVRPSACRWQRAADRPSDLCPLLPAACCLVNRRLRSPRLPRAPCCVGTPKRRHLRWQQLLPRS